MLPRRFWSDSGLLRRFSPATELRILRWLSGARWRSTERAPRPAVHRRLRLSFAAVIVLHEPSEEIQSRVVDAVREAVWEAVRAIPGVSIHGSGIVGKLEPT